MSVDIWGFATFLGLVVLGIIISLYNNRQAKALKAIQSVAEDWLFMQVKDRREQAEASVTVDDPIAWLSRESGYTITGVLRKFTSPLAVDLNTGDGCRIVVSPLAPGELKRALKPMQSGDKSVDRLYVPLLGRSIWPWSVKSFYRSLVTSGAWFDKEADLVGKAIGVDWNAVDRLYFYIVPNK